MLQQEKLALQYRQSLSEQDWIHRISVAPFSLVLPGGAVKEVPASVSSYECLRSALAFEGSESLPAHMYIRHEPIRKHSELSSILASSEPVHGVIVGKQALPESVEEFFKSLCTFEKTSGASKHATAGEVRLAEAVHVMIPESFPSSRLGELAEFVMKQLTPDYQSLPYCCRSYTKGDHGHFLVILTSERPYFFQEQSVEKLARSDFWRDPKTGRRASAGTPGAVLAYSKGDVIGTVKTHYAPAKLRIFRIPRGAFFYKMLRLKWAVLRFFRRVSSVPEYSLPRFSSNSFRYRKQKHGVAELNRFLIQCEQQLNELPHALSECGFTDSEGLIPSFVSSFGRTLLSQQIRFSYGRKSYVERLTFDSRSTQFTDFMNALKTVFENGYQELCESLFGPAEIFI